MLIAKAPGTDFLAFHIGNSSYWRVGPGNLKGTTALEDLSNVDQISPLFARGQHLWHPGNPELSLAGGNYLLRHNIYCAFQNSNIQAELFIETLGLGRIVAGKLRLGDPLELETDRGQFGAFGGSHSFPRPPLQL